MAVFEARTAVPQVNNQEDGYFFYLTNLTKTAPPHQQSADSQLHSDAGYPK